MKQSTINKGYMKESVLNKINNEFLAAVKAIRFDRNGSEVHVTISNGNRKTGPVASVSTLPYITCNFSECERSCGVECYAAKITNLYSNVRKSYAMNTAIALFAPELYWQEIDKAAKAVRYFRFHVSGDIINSTYFDNMVRIATNNPGTEFLAFTKRFRIVNEWIAKNGQLPNNLHILFSGWSNMQPDNPYELPETTVYHNDNEFSSSWLACGGNCFECGCRGLGCWQAKTGDTVAFKKH